MASSIKQRNCTKKHSELFNESGLQQKFNFWWQNFEDFQKSTCNELIMKSKKDNSQKKIISNHQTTSGSWSTSSHSLRPEIDKLVKEQVAFAKLNIGESSKDWQLFTKDGEIRMYRRTEQVDGIVTDPLKAVHTIQGVTGHEMCHYFFSPEYRYDWEITLEHMKVLGTISDDTLIFYQTHKSIWPISQRDIVFWSHIRELPADDKNGPNIWTVVNYSTEHPDYPANATKYIRIFMKVCLLCETQINRPKNGMKISRKDISCNITYCATINPGGWTPAPILRAVYKKEYPKFLKKFIAYVQTQTKDKPIMY